MARITMSEPKDKASAGESNVPAEPREITVWRQIIARREERSGVVRRLPRAEALARQFAARKGCPELAAEFIDDARNEATEARTEIEEIDAIVRGASPARLKRLAGQPGAHLLQWATRLVRLVLDDPDDRRCCDRADGALAAVARTMGTPPPASVQTLVLRARALVEDRDASRTSIARYVVTAVAGLPPDARVLRG